MTIETIKGIVGVKISFVDLVRLFLKYDSEGLFIDEAKATCEKSKKTLEEVLDLSDEEKESDDWSDLITDLKSNLSGRFNDLNQWVPHSLIIEETDQDYHFELGVYQLTHDRDVSCDFIIGEKLMVINTSNTHYGSLARANDKDQEGNNKRLVEVQTMMLSFMKSTTRIEEVNKRKNEMDASFPELKEKKMDFFLVQNYCECCS